MSLMLWLPGIALAVIALITYRRWEAAHRLLSPKGGLIAALQLGVLVLVLTGATSGTRTVCTPGAKSCDECAYFPPIPPSTTGSGWVMGLECDESGDWWNPVGDGFWGNGEDEAEACEKAGAACAEWMDD